MHESGSAAGKPLARSLGAYGLALVLAYATSGAVACRDRDGNDRPDGAAGEQGEAGNGAGGAAGSGAGAEGGTGGAGAEGPAAGEGGAEPEACPEFEPPEAVGELEPPEIGEASGLVQSARHSGVLYTHNDSGASPRAYAITEAGQLIATLELPGALNEDWEDIALGPGPEAEQSYLYIGDIGDNLRARTTSIAVHRALEPELDPDARDQLVELEYQTLYFKYPDEPHDAETLFLDPDTADLFIVTKGDSAGSGVYVARGPHSTTNITTLEKVTDLSFGSAPLLGDPLATGGDIDSRGERVLIRTYTAAYLWTRTQGPLDRVFSTEPCPVRLALELQGESIAFSADGAAYFTVSEGVGSTIWRGAFPP